MPVGEVPITSYFTRVPLKKKRKANPNTSSAVLPPAKRKRYDDEDDKPVKKEVRVQASLAFPKGSRKTEPARAKTHRALRDESLISAAVAPVPKSSFARISGPSASETLHSKEGRKRVSSPFVSKSYSLTDFHGDPPNVEQLSSLSPRAPSFSPALLVETGNAVEPKPVVFGSPSSAGFHNAPDPPDEDDDPTSFIVPSSQSQYIDFPNLPSPSFPEPSRSFTHRSHSDASQSDDPVPSSQSQYIPSYHCTPRPWNDSIDVVSSSHSQHLPPTPVHQRDDDGFIVPSSQSQWLPPVRLDKEDDCTGAADDEIIPSSQSQFEVELKPWKGSRRSPSQSPTSDGKPDHSLLAGPSPEPPTPLNLDLDFEDMFEGPLAPTEGGLVEDDSVTESDDDGPLLPRSLDAIPVPTQQREGYLSQPGFTSGDVQSLPDDGCGSAESFSSSLGSLPSVVKDFYDMFGTGDGSYPDDFPESLKWRGGETQD